MGSWYTDVLRNIGSFTIGGYRTIHSCASLCREKLCMVATLRQSGVDQSARMSIMSCHASNKAYASDFIALLRDMKGSQRVRCICWETWALVSESTPRFAILAEFNSWKMQPISRKRSWTNRARLLSWVDAVIQEIWIDDGRQTRIWRAICIGFSKQKRICCYVDRYVYIISLSRTDS